MHSSAGWWVENLQVGCTNYVGKKKGLSFYRFQLKNEECGKWEAAVRRDHWKPKSHSRICGEHFITGKN